MPKRENRKLHTLEPNRYCPPTFLLVRTYKWLCRNLETVHSRELKLLTSTLLNYASYPKTEFHAANKEILSQVIQHCKSNRLRRRALREPDMTLQNLMDIGRAMEVADSQAQTMEEQCERATETRSTNHVRV